MSRSSKRSLEQKLVAVKWVLAGKWSIHEAGLQLSVGQTTIRRWVRLYQMGEEGLRGSSSNRHYPISLKLSAVRTYLAGGVSLEAVCQRYEIRSACQLSDWIHVYSSHGKFKNSHGGGRSRMTQGRRTTQEERVEIVSYCIANDKDYGKTIDRYGVSYQQIYSWVRKYEADGVDGLCDRRGKRKDEASMSEVEKLQARIKLKEAENYQLRMENDLLKKLAELEGGWDDED